MTNSPTLTDAEAEAMARLVDAFGRAPAQRDQSPLGRDIRCLLASHARLSSRLASLEADNRRLRAILEPLRELSERATAGPWEFHEYDGVDLDEPVVLIEHSFDHNGQTLRARIAEATDGNADELGTDAAFITAAVNAVREALALSPEREGSIAAYSASTAVVEAAPRAAPPEGWVLVPRKPTRDWAYTVANSLLGEGPSVRCEGPSGPELESAQRWINRVLAAAPNPPASDALLESATTTQTEGEHG